MMDQPDNATALRAEDVRRICGDMLDWKLAAILALNAPAGELAAAAAWAAGRDELGQEGRPLEGLAAQVYDILVSDEFLEDER